jgi:ATP-binding cassette subfamily B protein
MNSRTESSLAAARRLAAVGKPPLWWGAGVIATLVVSAALGTLPPLFTGRIVDALQALNAKLAMQELAAFVAVTLIAGIASFANTYSSTVFREAIARNLRVFMMHKLLRARLGGLEKLTLGEIANRINVDVHELCSRFEYSLFPSLQGICALIATAAVMLALDYRFALISFAAVAFGVLPTKLTTARYTALQRQELKVQDELAGALNESATLSALALLRNARAAARESAAYAGLADRSRHLRLSSSLLSGIAGFATTLVNLAGPIAVLALGAYLLLHHAVSVGTIVTFLMYQARLYGPFAGLSVLPLQLASIGVTAGRVLEIADLEEETSGDRPFVAGDVALSGVSVVRERRTIVNDANVHVPHGARAAIVGASGSGKSTIAMLLLRLHDTAAGTLRIAGHDVRDIDLARLREAVAVVAQDPLIFDTTLLENLTYTNPLATRSAIDRAVRLCRLDEVVARLPEGLDARLGQRGFRLSGGERQRICLARALLQDPEILVLDEALTGVDVETEARIVADLRDELHGKTLIVITHRLASIEEFDPIVVVEEGEITVQGTHAEACAASQWYRVASQASRFSEQAAYA